MRLMCVVYAKLLYEPYNNFVLQVGRHLFQVAFAENSVGA